MDSVSIRDSDDDGEFTSIPETRTDGCWVGTDIPYTTSYFESVELEPCDSYRSEFFVISHPDNDGCQDDGVYDRTDEGKLRTDEVEFSVTVELTVRR